jgi:hypothetical protein
MVDDEQLCVGASTELLTSLNGDRGSIWRQPQCGLIRLFFNIFVFFGDVVNVRLVLLAIGVDHRSSVALTRVAFLLHVAFLITVAAHNIVIARAVASDGGSVGGGGMSHRRIEVVVVARRLFTMDGHNLFDFFVGQFIPEDGGGLTRLHIVDLIAAIFCNLLRSF